MHHILVSVLVAFLTVSWSLIRSAIIEIPDKKWLDEKFPDELWYATQQDVYVWAWLAAVHDWDRIVKQWGTGDYSSHQPRNQAALPPLGGLVAVLTWSQERGRAKQEQLIGMTKADEQAVFENWDALNQVYTKSDDAAAAEAYDQIKN
eukprot:SAG31_NODE_99_length_25388_cov_12.710507_11_plen_148_part_00